MPSALTYPGVYIEEVPSGVRTITGVSTSVAAFIGFFKRGSTQSAIQVFNFSEFTREFGGLDGDSEASYAVQRSSSTEARRRGSFAPPRRAAQLPLRFR